MAAVEVPLTSPYLSTLYSVYTMTSPPASGVLPGPALGTLDWVHNVPPTITTLLVQLAPFLSGFRSALEIVSWRSADTARSWLLLLSWLTLCLGFEFGLKYLLPILFVVPYLLPPGKLSIFRRSQPETTSDIAQGCSTEETLTRALADVTLIVPLFPFNSQQADSSSPASSQTAVKPLWAQLSNSWPISRILRVLCAIYVPYLVLLHFIPKRLVVAILGTVFLTWRSPWAQITRRIIGNNGFSRYIVRRTLSFVLGVPIEIPGAKAIAMIVKTNTAPKDDDLPAPNALRFRFIVHENQRWWLGVDWSAALLPNERPSWSSAAPDCLPLPPPASFTLPGPSSIVLPWPTNGKKSEKPRFIKRTATWHWAEPDWGVVVKSEATGKAERVSKPLTAPPSEANTGLPEQLLTRGLKRVATSPTRAEYGSDVHGESGESSTGGSHRRQSSSAGALERSDDIETDLTDPEGWIYGGNKWEGAGNKGGMGKYTRHRRWTRLAVLTESVEKVNDPALPSSQDNKTEVPPGQDTPAEMDDEKSADHSLRKRLKAVVKGGHGSRQDNSST